MKKKKMLQIKPTKKSLLKELLRNYILCRSNKVVQTVVNDCCNI